MKHYILHGLCLFGYFYKDSRFLPLKIPGGKISGNFSEKLVAVLRSNGL